MLQGLAQFRVALLNSLNSRTFSIAITAWSAKVSRSVICLSVKGRTSVRRIRMTPMGTPFSQQRRSQAWSEHLPVDGNLSSPEIRFCSFGLKIVNMDQSPGRPWLGLQTEPRMIGSS